MNIKPLNVCIKGMYSSTFAESGSNKQFICYANANFGAGRYVKKNMFEYKETYSHRVSTHYINVY